MKTLIRVVCFIALVLGVQALVAFSQSINCGSGFTSSGACATSPVVGSAAWGLYSGGFLSGSQVNLVPSGSTHNGYALIYQTAVSSQAFTSTFTFIPNGYNLAFVMQNNTETGASAPGPHFASGAGCEGGFYQGVNPGVNNIFALELDSYSNTGSSGSFTYSTAQIYQQNQPPCNPQNGGETYFWGPTQKLSTSPVPLNSPATSQGTTTGDVYSATITYDGSNVTLTMFDVTAGGSCPGTSCFTHTWSNVSIPSLVGGTTAYIGLTSGVGNTTSNPLYINTFTYTPETATASPGSTPPVAGYTTAANPTFSPAAGSYTSAQSVTISDATSGAYVCYSLGAAGQVIMPAPNNLGGCQVGTLYSGPVTVSSSETLYAVAGTNLTSLPSGYAQASYTINPCPIPAGASSATIVSTISGCTSGETVTFAAGTYSLANTATVPCGVSIAGPTVALAQYTGGDGYNRYGYTPTAIINWTGSAPGIMFNRGACSTTASINYIECNMNQPSGGGGQCVYNGAVTSNFSEFGDYFHGNQANSSGSSTADSLDYFDGDGSTTDTNISITWSRFGASGDCSNIMNVHTNYSGSCNGVGFHNSASNLTVNNNFFYYNENELKFYEGCSYANDSQTTCTPASGMETCLTCTVEYNDFSNFHRIGFETQVNYRPVSSSSPSVAMVIRYNSLHDPYYPSGITFGISSANGCDNTTPSPGGCVTNTDDNVIIDNVPASSGNLADGIEQWGSTGSTANNNLIQGEWANSIIINKDGAFSDYGNLIQSSYGAAGSNTPADCYPAFFGAFGWWGVSNSPANTPVPTSAGGTNANTCSIVNGSVQTSAQPTISPGTGTFTTSQSVTLANSGTNRDANTTIWYTTDGSTPVPGTANLYTGPFTVTSTTTVKAVGMWGAANQPFTYPTGPLSGTYGYQPSAASTATYTKSGGPLAAPSGISVIVVSENNTEAAPPISQLARHLISENQKQSQNTSGGMQ